MTPTPTGPPVILSFDVEEHHRIEAAAKLTCGDDLKRTYSDRMEASTRRLLAQLADAGATATFYIVGEIAVSHPKLLRDIAAAGHEIGSHSWDHQRVSRFTPDGFREDLKKSVDALEQAAGVKVVGFRAPTFSVTKRTPWAVDVLAESGLRYDSSVFPVRHDRYGVPAAPRTPFLLQGERGSILELPLVTYRLLGQNLPVAGGGYFRLFPLSFLRAGVNQLAKGMHPVGVLYFHPWEFDPGQPKLPLGRLSRFRTYVGIGSSAKRFESLLKRYAGRFRRAMDVAAELDAKRGELPRFTLGL